jgi:hypothetical protein
MCLTNDKVETIHIQHGSISDIGFFCHGVFGMSSGSLGGLSCAGQKLTPASSPVREVTSGFSPLEHTWHPDQEHEIPTKKPRLNFPSPKIVIPGDAGNEAVVTGKVSYNH